MKFENYKDGIDMNQFSHIKEGSLYNKNYYSGFGLDLLLAVSNDDDITEWYVVIVGEKHYLGESRTSKGEILIRFENSQT